MNNSIRHANRLLSCLLAGALSASLAVPNFIPAIALAADKPAGKSDVLGEQSGQVIGDEITPGQEKAVTKGLEYLASQQQADGTFSNGSGFGATAGITALSGLAFMANGNLPGRGKYGDVVKKASKYILRSQQESGLFTAGQQTSGEMYSHGFATLFIGELYGMTGDDEIKENLQRAVKLIENAQNDEGGWRYQPIKADADISVTICQVMALRAARDAGVKVEASVIDKAIGYVKKCQCADGGFTYMANQGMGSGFARTGAGTAALFYAGAFKDKAVQRGVDWLNHMVPSPNHANPEDGSYFFYGNYYACQAMYLAGGKYWKAWYPGIRDVLIQRQDKSSGAWSGEIDNCYCTAMALIIMQMPNRYLPVFNGKGPGS